jgi:nucleoside-triphosphatase
VQYNATLPASPLATLNSIPPGLTLITGPRGSGKTTWCAALVDRARAAHQTIGGILCPAIFHDDRKTGIQIEALHSGERRLLGSRTPAPGLSQKVGAWHVDPAALQWGDTILRNLPPVDLTIIDELGPLEFDEGGGFQTGLGLLDRAQYRTACVVIRPDLLLRARRRWPAARIIDLSGGSA